MKICIKCGIEKNLEEFGFSHRNNDGLKKICKQCWTEGYKEEKSNESKQAADKTSILLEQRKNLLSTGFKTCTQCKQIKSLSEFGRRKDTLDGYKFACNQCEQIRINTWKDKNKEFHKNNLEKKFNENIEKIQGGTVTKKCICCNIEKPANEFYLHKGSSDGLRSRCIKCLNQQVIKYKKENYIKTLEDKKKRENSDKFRKERRNKYQENPEYYREISKRWREKHPDYNKVSTLEKRLSFWKHNALGRNIEWDLTIGDLKDMPLQCFYTNQKLTLDSNQLNTISLDRIDSSKSYTKDNVVFCCADINRMKSNFSLDYFISLCEKITQNKERILNINELSIDKHKVDII